MSFLLYVLMSAWQDGKQRAVSGWLFLFFFVHFLTSQICCYACSANMENLPAAFWFHGIAHKSGICSLWMGSLIGGVLILVSYFSEGSMGKGDGIFFFIAGIYLGFWKNLILLCSSLFLCSFAGLVYLMWGMLHGKDYRKRSLPFLVFALPAGIFFSCR